MKKVNKTKKTKTNTVDTANTVNVKYTLKPNEFYCDKCNKVHTKSMYAVAQLTMGHELIFTCECGNTIEHIPD